MTDDHTDTATGHAVSFFDLVEQVTADRDRLAAVVEVARAAAQRLLDQERQHSGSGRDGHLAEDDLAPLLRALDAIPAAEPA